MSKTTFEDAYCNWHTLVAVESDDAFADLEKAEQVILDHHPQTAAEAEKIVHVLHANAEIGPRGDGRDVGALDRLRCWLAPRVPPA